MKKLILVLFLMLPVGCSTPQETLSPIHITQTEASFDGNDKDSGVKEFVPGKGFVLSQAAADRYSALVIKYKEQLVGLSGEDGKIYLNNEGMVLFLGLVDKDNNK